MPKRIPGGGAQECLPARYTTVETALADHSVLFLNKHLVNEGPEVWDEAAIKDRAKWLHERAVKIWPHAGEFELVLIDR